MDPDRNEELWLSLAHAVSKGDAVDWDRVEQQAVDQEENGVVRALRALDRIARVHKSTSPTMTAATESRQLSADLERWGHLVILERVGQGTFGAVYRAREEGLDREVALKLLWSTAGDIFIDPAAVLKEARLLARVRHPNVVTVYGAESTDGRVGLWMEFIRGRTLEDLLTVHGPFGAREATAIGIDLCHALAAVHGAGLLHRDVKCRNVMREEGGRIVLMDFGAGADVSARQPASQDGVAGTPMYLAPELFDGGPPSVAADVYSLGVLIYHLVSGSYPVEGQTNDDIRQVHARGERRRLRDSRPDLPDAFVRVVERALACDPKERYKTAGAFADELAASPLGFSSAGSSDRRYAAGNPPLKPDSTWLGRQRLLAAALVLVTLAGGGWWWHATSASRARDRQTALGGEVPLDADPASYEIGAKFHLVRAGTRAALRSGDRVEPGDRLFLTVQASKPIHVYVVNQDEQGESFLMFPLPGQNVTNPLPAGTVNRLPGSRGQKALEELYWQVTSVGGREHFFVFASQNRLVEFEQSLAGLSHTQIDRPVVSVPLPKQTMNTLRGVGGLAKADANATAASRAFPFATPLLETAENVRGFWAREIVFENPGR